MGPLLPSLIAAAALGGLGPGDGMKKVPDLTQIRPGVPASEALRILGPPQRVARQIVYKRCLEQWVYDQPIPLRIEVDWVQGRQSHILTVHSITSRSP